MSNNKSTCKNCEQIFNHVYKFCPYCGQKDKEHLTVGLLFNNTISNYFSVDARFFKSFIPLLFRPGYLASKFIEGKRLLYLHPAQLYLFISVVFFFLFSFKVNEQEQVITEAIQVSNEAKNIFNTNDITSVNDSLESTLVIEKLKENQQVLGLEKKEIKTLDSIFKTDTLKSDMDNVKIGDINIKTIDSLINTNAKDELIYNELGVNKNSGYFKKKFFEQSLKLYKNNGNFTNMLRSFYDSIPIALFILLPLFALIMKLLFFKRGRYAYHLVFSFYFFAYLFATFSIIVITSFIWTNMPGWLDFLLVLSTFIYLWIAVKQFYKQSWSVSLIKSVTATFAFSLVGLVAIVCISMFAFMYF